MRSSGVWDGVYFREWVESWLIGPPCPLFYLSQMKVGKNEELGFLFIELLSRGGWEGVHDVALDPSY